MLFFSLQAIATIGSGTMAARSAMANVLFSAEAITGLIGFALVTGLTFAKFSRPTARIRFSRNAVISNRDGVPSLMFRMANERENQILEAQVHVVLIRSETTEEGESVRRFYDLELLRDRNALFALSWTAIHPITERSPLLGTTPDSLVAQHAVVVVSLTGLDETLLQTVPARHAYIAKDIVFGARLADILTPTDGGSWMIDSARFDEVQPASLTSVQSTSISASLSCDG